MLNRILPLYSWDNGAFVMIVLFGLVIIGLVGAVMLMASGAKNKKD
ncbi:hypothetical protein [Flavobacterium sp.]|jgi:hypothetical protein|nr:hypothetical protein [Flavobacterium sp.]MCZ8145468.1 hypothetical protein [Flavobacterium sp.]MCZ8366175.1 hypothetical protein [Flavobacterium sp.]